MDLNDPFEFFGAELTNCEFRKAMKEAKHAAHEYTGLICFSANWKNPVQWAHYADKHKGLCLGFNIDDSHLEEVDYVEERVQHNNLMDEDLVFRLLRTKYVHWKYEEEYRVLIELEDQGGYYANFEGNMTLKRVIVGANSTLTRSQLNTALGGLSSTVETFKARAGFQKFEMVKNKNGALWA